MDSVSTMNLSDGGDSMTPFFSQPAPEQRLAQKPQEVNNLVYSPNVQITPEKNAPEKNISKSKAMDSTPLSDLMMPGEDYLGPAGGGADPRQMMSAQPSYVQQQMPTPQGYANQGQKQQKPATSSKNPMNLTDEQMEALLAGVVALLAFSGFAQDKLSTLVPKFLDEAGKRSTVGTLVTALLVAVLFYFGRRFVIRD
jgi:hypothetical protein